MNSEKSTALITGASAGIGASYARHFAHRGHDLVLVARDAARLQALAAKLTSEAGVKVDVLPADLTKKSELLRVEQRLANDIDIFVNNAGLIGPFTLVGSDADALETVVQLNVVAATRLAAVAATAFAARRRGAIINLSSIVSLVPELYGSAYGASKAYMLHLSQSMAQELAGTGVSVQAVLPGATRTEIWERAGMDVANLDPNIVMEVDEMVEAALAGLDRGELVTIPSLPDAADFEALNAARNRLGPNLSRKHAAERYRTGVNAAA